MVSNYVNDRSRHGVGRAGFTLIEVLTSLIIMSVATSIFINYFLASKNVADLSRAQRVAAQLAEERIADIQNYPTRYHGTVFESTGNSGGLHFEGETVSLALKEGELLSVGEPPSAMPTDERAYERTKNLYQGFIWKAYVHRPPAETTYQELVLVVSWIQAGRPKVLALTTALPGDAQFEMKVEEEETEAEEDVDADEASNAEADAA